MTPKKTELTELVHLQCLTENWKAGTDFLIYLFCGSADDTATNADNQNGIRLAGSELRLLSVSNVYYVFIICTAVKGVSL